jgi:hypothetical protein
MIKTLLFENQVFTLSRFYCGSASFPLAKNKRKISAGQFAYLG